MKQVFILLGFILFSGSLLAQGAYKVKRKGVQPIDVTKRPSTTTTTTTGGPVLYNINQIDGKWQEIRRIRGNSSTGFTDTMLIMVNNGRGFIKSDESMTMTMQGNASIEGSNTLAIAGDTYSIKKLSDRSLVIADDDQTHILRRVPYFAFENAGKDSIVLPRYEIKESINLKSVSGKWQVYRRQAEPGFINGNTTLIKYLTISGYNDDGTATGEIVTYNGDNIMQTSPATISFSGSKLHISTDKGAWQYDVYRADEHEFIFGDAKGVMNYAKH